MIKKYLLLFRCKDYIKNFFIFLPLIFSQSKINNDLIFNSILSFIYFCIAASAVYIVNDLYDYKNDKKSEFKSARPIASGKISKPTAIIFLIILFLILLIGFLLSNLTNVFIIIFLYLVINFFYSFTFKNIPILELFIVSSGFVLRVIAGGEAIDAHISNWMIILTMSLAFYLIAVKRKSELIAHKKVFRPVLKLYNKEILDLMINLSQVLSIVFYCFYISTSRPDLFLSIPLVIYGFIRYMYCVTFENKGYSPVEILLGDIQIKIVIFLWCSLPFCLYLASNKILL